MHSRVGAVTTLLFGDLLGSVGWFPVWWYTQGLGLVLRKIDVALRYRARSYAFSIWVRNLLVPMYGQSDLMGRAVSIFMRIVVLIGRGIAWVAEALLYLVGLVVWCLWIPATIFLIILNLL
jgi:hypothetical protein